MQIIKNITMIRTNDDDDDDDDDTDNAVTSRHALFTLTDLSTTK